MRQLGRTLTLDRLFAVVQSILVASRRQEFVRKTLFFDALDLLEGLRQGGYDRLLDPVAVSKDVDRLRETLPASVQPVILPRCQAGADALARMKDGFWVKERVTENGVLLPHKAGKENLIAFRKAVPLYLRVVRNATHGLSREVSDPQSRALMAAHDGELPEDLPDVAFLHLVRLMTNPQSLEPEAYK